MSWSVLWEGAKFSLVAQSAVFFVLFLLAVMILILKLLFYRPPAGAKAAPTEPVEAEEPEELTTVAAVAAALEMHRQAASAQAPPIVAAEGPWAPRATQGRAAASQSKSRRWSHD
jgi:Na+-transporting methylmalonyl-CoA/oxaloacetate decarboxylase gamma subunit